MSKPKIVVLHMRELIYTAIFIFLILVLLILLFLMFRPVPFLSDMSILRAVSIRGLLRIILRLGVPKFGIFP